ncbi:MAG: hypothetical protein WB755_14790 [Terriglobales bacterium]
MATSCLRLDVLFVVGVIAATPGLLRGQQPPATGTAVHMVVTVEARHGSDVPAIQKEDVMVYQGRDRVKTVDWIPLQGDRAALELFLLLDDAAGSSLGSQLEDLRKFINSQPAATRIGVGYMRDGTVQIVQNLTEDHNQAAKSLRLPIGIAGVNASPYFSVSDLIKRWPEAPVRREIVMISDGIDRYGPGGSSDPYVDEAVEQAQKAGIVIFSIYTPGAGHFGHTFWRINWGQNYLSQLSDETGAESYYLGSEAPVSFSPYLDDLGRRLLHQYLLTFLAKPVKKAEMQSVKLRTEVSNAELVAADRVYVPASE